MITTTEQVGPSLDEALANLRASKERAADLRARYSGDACDNHDAVVSATFVTDGPDGTHVLCDPCHDRVAGADGLHVTLPEAHR